MVVTSFRRLIVTALSLEIAVVNEQILASLLPHGVLFGPE